MKFFKNTFFLLFICISHFGFSQEEKTMEWNVSKKLSWSDFKDNPPASSPIAAVTASGISYEFSAVSDVGKMDIDFNVHAYFYPEKSWYRPKVCNNLILSHEQLHFDITELFARKMRNELSAKTFTANIKTEVKVIYERIIKELSEYQELYDNETNFSRNTGKQLQWNKKIVSALAK